MIIATKLTHIESTSIYESAFVFGVPETIKHFVEEYRRTLSTTGMLGETLPPHLTIFYNGIQSGANLLNLLRKFNPPRIDSVKITGIGTFTNSEGRVSNIHITVKNSSKLMQVHRQALIDYKGLRLTLQSIYTDDQYSPHITILDKIESKNFILPNIVIPKQSIKLTSWYLLGKPISKNGRD